MIFVLFGYGVHYMNVALMYNTDQRATLSSVSIVSTESYYVLKDHFSFIIGNHSYNCNFNQWQREYHDYWSAYFAALDRLHDTYTHTIARSASMTCISRGEQRFYWRFSIGALTSFGVLFLCIGGLVFKACHHHTPKDSLLQQPDSNSSEPTARNLIIQVMPPEGVVLDLEEQADGGGGNTVIELRHICAEVEQGAAQQGQAT